MDNKIIDYLQEILIEPEHPGHLKNVQLVNFLKGLFFKNNNIEKNPLNEALFDEIIKQSNNLINGIKTAQTLYENGKFNILPEVIEKTEENQNVKKIKRPKL